MKNSALTMLLCAGLLVCSLDANADKTGYYRWADDEGKQHFTQQPPKGRKYDFVETRSGATIHSDGTDLTSANEPENNGSDAAPEKMEILPPKDPALCKKAKGNMQSLKANGARIRITNADGSTRMLNTEEIKQQENRAQQVIKLHCN